MIAVVVVVGTVTAVATVVAPVVVVGIVTAVVTVAAPVVGPRAVASPALELIC